MPVLRQAIADAPAPVLRPRARPRHRGARDGRRDRGAGRRAARAARRRRRGRACSSRCTTATRRASRWPVPSPCRYCCARDRRHATGSTPTSCARAITPRTKLILLNTPHNPTGKVFDADELHVDRRPRHRARPDRRHRRGLRAPRVRRSPCTSRWPRCRAWRERTLTISSGGKTFNTTGWKIGWICGPAPLVTAARTAKQFLTYVNGAPFQPAIAVGLGLPRRVLRRARRRPAGQARPPRRRPASPPGSPCTRPQATYFVDRRHPPGATRRRRHGVLPRRCPSGAGSWRSRTRCSTPTSRARPAPGALRVLQAPRGDRRSRRAPVEGVRDDRDAARRRDPARHRLARPRRQLRPARPDDRRGRRWRRRSGPADRDVLDRLRRSTRRHRRAGGRAVVAVPRRAGRAAHGVWVGGSCPEIAPDAPADDQRPSNTFVLAGPDGTAHRYRKIHPFSHGGEEQYVRAGTEFVTVDVEGLRVSLFVCYDLRFADEFWQLAARHRRLPRARQLAGEATAALATLLQARAIENQAYVVGVNRVGIGRRPRLLRRQRDHRPARRAPGDRRRRRDDPVRRHRHRSRRLHPRPLPLPPGPPLTPSDPRLRHDF